MFAQAPRFWDNPKDAPGWQARVLSPLAALWRWETARRLSRPAQYQAPCPVICIGNLTVGGTGKTPVVQDLMAGLIQNGRRPVVLSRGHGGASVGPLAVDTATHQAKDVGDEPLLLAQFGPVWVARNRSEGARTIVSADAGDIILMDDGFQSPSLAKDLAVVVVDAKAGFGNGRIVPSGPLREPVASGLVRADAVVTMGEPEHGEALVAGLDIAPKHHLGASLRPLQTGLSLAGMPVIAFAGIGRPEKFFASLRDQGAKVLATHPLADHAVLSETFLRRVVRDARLQGAQVVTTEKDAMRLPDWARLEIQVLPVRIAWHGQTLTEFCVQRLGL
ncbi:MAG: tetraacyldisaccharide 4'-kinase [Pseudomonadota bacterium]